MLDIDVPEKVPNVDITNMYVCLLWLRYRRGNIEIRNENFLIWSLGKWYYIIGKTYFCEWLYLALIFLIFPLVHSGTNSKNMAKKMIFLKFFKKFAKTWTTRNIYTRECENFQFCLMFHISILHIYLLLSDGNFKRQLCHHTYKVGTILCFSFDRQLGK